jgi:hypothetical protein
MNKIETIARVLLLPDELDRPLAVLRVALFEPVKFARRSARRKEFAGDLRTLASGDGSSVSARVHFPFKHGEHLLGTASALVGDGQQGVRNIKDTEFAHVRQRFTAE